MVAGCASIDVAKSWRALTKAELVTLSDRDGDGVIGVRDQCDTTHVGLYVDNQGCSLANDTPKGFELDVDFSNLSTSINETQHEKIRRFLTGLSQLNQWHYKVETYSPKSKRLSIEQTLNYRRLKEIESLLVNDYGIAQDIVSAKINHVEFRGDLPVIDNDIDGDGVENDDDRCANSHINYQVDEVGCVVFEHKHIKQRFTLRFDKNSAQITGNYGTGFKSLSRFIKQYKVSKLQIIGHSSETGPREFNRVLSLLRARNVAERLVGQHSIDVDDIKVLGLGESQLLSVGDELDDHKLNRRVEVIIDEYLDIEKLKEKRLSGHRVKITAIPDIPDFKEKWHIFIMRDDVDLKSLL